MNIKTHPRFLFLVNIGLVSMLLAGCAAPVTVPVEVVETSEIWDRFEAKVEYLRQQMNIPGLSAAVVMDQKLAWAKGFGYADLENRIEATRDTPYFLASVTKTIAATLIMQLVQEGAISLDDPISKYGIELESDGTILVRHLLMHASTGVPGKTFIYDGDRYGYLSQIAERATGKSFGALMKERILNPLGMTGTWMDFPQCAISLGLSPYPIDWRSETQVARPYQLDRSFDVTDSVYRYRGFNAAAGLISTVVDLAKFDIALDQNILLEQATKEMMLAPAIAVIPGRPDLAHGLGWFAEDYMDIRLNWHAGCGPPSMSANIIKAPDQNLTFIILANTAQLNIPWPSGDILYHTMALAFFETFVYPRQSGKTVPEVNWEADEADLVKQLNQIKDPDLRKILERELWAYRQLFFSVGKSELATRLLNVHQVVFPDFSPTSLDTYTTTGPRIDTSPGLTSDQVQLTPAELERLTGTYILSDAQANRLSIPIPLEIQSQVLNGKLIISFVGSCIDLVAKSPTQFITPDQQISISFQMDGEEVERIVVQLYGMVVVYLPKE